ncbi:MAG: crossover junction endodeoxyribonuclease RuvC [Cyclobacteriaceae bacterium]
MKKEKIILGIDPGTNVMGYGLIKCIGQQMEIIQFGVIHLSKYKNHEVKLQKIFQRVSSIIEEYIPDEVALESPFFGKDVQAMLKLGRAQGVAMAAALHKEIPINEYAPRKIKQSVTGNGNSSKEQVAAMLKNLLKFEENPKLLDATDALAVAVCHHFSFKVGTNGKSGSSSWKSFISENPKRIK